MSAGGNRDHRGNIRIDSPDGDLRKGKWTVEEENYANKIISLFNQGLLPVVVGTTLRTYLSDKLRCDPMRITKKYAGASCIGKQVFQLAENYHEVYEENERELQRLEGLFLARISGKAGGLAGKRNGSSDALASRPSVYETVNGGGGVGSRVHQTPTLAIKQDLATSMRRKQHPAGRLEARTSPKIEGSPGKYQRSASDGVGERGRLPGAVRMEDGSGDGDYGYAVDPGFEDEYEQAPPSFEFRPSTQQNGLLGRSLYASASMGRRVLSAPNLSELGLSSWKETDYRPLPADSLREIFSLPVGELPTGPGLSNLGGSERIEHSLLPQHVYSALGTDSGRYVVSGRSAGLADGVGQEPYNSLQARKRCFSAMALVDFERLAGDDIAAGDLFLEFLDKVKGGAGGGGEGPPVSGGDTDGDENRNGGATDLAGDFSAPTPAPAFVSAQGLSDSTGDQQQVVEEGGQGGNHGADIEEAAGLDIE